MNRNTIRSMLARDIQSTTQRSSSRSSNWACGAIRNEPPSRGPLQATAITIWRSVVSPSTVIVARMGCIVRTMV